MFFRRISVLILVGLLWGGALAHAEETKESCALRYARVVSGWVKAAPGRFVTFQKEYWPEVWRTKGLRLFVVKRENPRKINWIYLIDDPISEGLRLKYRMSIPLSMAAWGGLGYWMDSKAEDNRLKFALGSEEYNLAAPVLLQYYQYGLIDSKELTKAIKKHHKELEQYLVNPKPGARHPRLEEFRELGLLKNDAEERTFVELVRKTYLEISEKDPEGKGRSFVNRFYEAFQDALGKDPAFRAKPDADFQMLMFLFVPKMKLEGSRDLLVARRVLEGKDPHLSTLPGVAAELGLPAAMAVEVATREESEQDRAKRLVKARAFGMPENRLDTLRRAPLSLYNQKFEFQDFDGGTRTLPSEVSRWEMILSDFRFQGLAEQWKQGQISDAAALAQHEAWLRGLEAIYKEKNESPDPARICSHLEKNNPVLAPALVVVDAVKKQVPKTSTKQLRYCRWEVGRFYWESHLRQGGEPRSAAWLEAETQKLEALVVERCLGASPKNLEQYRCPSEK